MPLKIIKSSVASEDVSLAEQVADVLADGGLVCLPCNGSYRIVADVNNPSAVTRLFQSKRRTSKAPSLIFVDGLEMLATVVDAVEPLAQELAKHHWPGQLTILFKANDGLPSKVRKEVQRAVGKIGVRVPQGFAKEVVSKLGRPLLVSSANKEKKQGAGSPAQVRKNFVHKIDLFVDSGDLPTAPSSTVVDISEGGFTITRPGALSHEQLSASLSAT